MAIKGIILDIDGVIVGEKIGFNSPWPHPAVIEALTKIRRQGIPICLITAKPHFAVSKIIKDAELKNPHITDGGSVIIDPIDNIIVKKHIIDKELATKALELFLQNSIYVEFYTVNDYFVQQNQVSEITQKHQHILQRSPVIVPSLIEEVTKLEITKIMPIAQNIEDSKRVNDIFKPLADKLNLYWAVHPVALPLQFGIVVPDGIDKTAGIKEVGKSLKVSFDELLSVGDSTSDWQFIQLCKYGAAMGNATQELKDLVKSKGTEFSYIAPSVDDNGILDIFKHWGLYKTG